MHGSLWAETKPSFENDVYIFVRKGAWMSLYSGQKHQCVDLEMWLKAENAAGSSVGRLMEQNSSAEQRDLLLLPLYQQAGRGESSLYLLSDCALTRSMAPSAGLRSDCVYWCIVHIYRERYKYTTASLMGRSSHHRFKPKNTNHTLWVIWAQHPCDQEIHGPHSCPTSLPHACAFFLSAALCVKFYTKLFFLSP